MYYKVFNSKTCFPEPVILNGTFSSEGINITTNTISTLQVGDYLYSTTNNELREVATISTPTRFTIKSAFSSDVINETIKIADKSVSYAEASIFNFSRTDGLFNGSLFPKRSSINIDSGIIVFTLDATGINIAVLAT